VKRETAKRSSGAARQESDVDLIPPQGMAAHRFDVGPDAFAILEFPVGDPASVPAPDTLTPSEQDVMRLILEGKSNQEIAHARRRAVRTIANQIASIFKKLRVGSRCELYAVAVRSQKRDVDG
jgi:DNA-binding NarL/FixJ family response regulator